MTAITSSGASDTERARNLTSGAERWTASSTARPPPPGMWTSSSTTSGRAAAIRRHRTRIEAGSLVPYERGHRLGFDLQVDGDLSGPRVLGSIDGGLPG